MITTDQTRILQTQAEKRTRMLAIENEYIKTRAYLASPEWAAKRDSVLLRIIALIARYQGKDATEAAFILGQVKQTYVELQEVSDIIVEFESLRKQVNDPRMSAE